MAHDNTVPPSQRITRFERALQSAKITFIAEATLSHPETEEEEEEILLSIEVFYQNSLQHSRDFKKRARVEDTSFHTQMHPLVKMTVRATV